jgi:hypothetical protein
LHTSYNYQTIIIKFSGPTQIQIPPEPLAAHRAEIVSLQHRRSFASSCRSCVFTLIFVLSLAMVLRSVSLGIPHLLVPAGFQLKACRGSLLLSILNTCLRYFQRRFFINVEASSCFLFLLLMFYLAWIISIVCL